MCLPRSHGQPVTGLEFETRQGGPDLGTVLYTEYCVLAFGSA